ncbi:DNA-binding transcriptional regulator, LysR family [Arboricoccus pini]|uniref:DNA-binding transcriptional regulator, LysR family n=1 Tax=Arboricoccus pini TaxID=1963835 RepID=A0A212RYF1_9PROT|nr:LysR family transcriptional regulator [Arboricoccus pini]SNB77783.1 DNA-binding transcriptional regulator, LysR family [Arboricoccus pini]
MGLSTVNRSGEMEIFVQAVDRGGFSAAAKALGLTPSGVSKLVTRMEARLGVRLLLRSTRQLQLTPEGRTFYGRCVRVLADIAEAEREASAGAVPRGPVRINANVPFGLHKLLPLVPGLRARYPAVDLDIVLTDRIVDLAMEGADVAIRSGILRPSRLRARKLGESGYAIVGSPAYLERHGTPRSLAELERHARLSFDFTRSVPDWQVLHEGQIVTLPPSAGVLASNGESLRRLALDGVGLTRLNLFHIGPDIRAGTLVPVLEDLNPRDTETVHAVYLGHAGPLPARIRAVLDHLVEHVTLP